MEWNEKICGGQNTWKNDLEKTVAFKKVNRRDVLHAQFVAGHAFLLLGSKWTHAERTSTNDFTYISVYTLQWHVCHNICKYNGNIKNIFKIPKDQNFTATPVGPMWICSLVALSGLKSHINTP